MSVITIPAMLLATKCSAQLAPYLSVSSTRLCHLSVQFGHSAAHRACLLGCKNSVGVLVHNGADFSLEDCSGHTPLTIAQVQ